MRFIFIFITSFVVIAGHSHAQNDNRYFPNHPGSWKYKVEEERFPRYHLTAAERKTLLEKAETATRLIKSFPAFATPKGVELTAITQMKYEWDDSKRVKATDPLPLELVVSIANYIKENGKIVVASNTSTYRSIEMYFNNVEAAFDKYQLSYERLLDQQGNEYYLEPAVLKTFDNCTIYSNNRMLYLKPGVPLWIPVTAKQYLDALLNQFSRSIKEGHTDLQMVYDNIKNELKELPAEDYEKPAYHNSQMGTNLSQLSLEKTANTTAIVKFNPNYFDKTKPRTAVQLLVVDLGFSSYDYSEPIADNDERYALNEMQLYHFFTDFDFKQFERLLD